MRRMGAFINLRISGRAMPTCRLTRRSGRVACHKAAAAAFKILRMPASAGASGLQNPGV